MNIENPALPGFHPDPSICRVGDEFYLATSTFEWFPGVMIYSSRDLATWTLRAVPLDRVELLDMAGNPPSGGVWAPCLSHDGERFYLVYTNVRSWVGSVDGTNAGFKDSHNYVTSAPTVEGPWSEPVYLNSSGFDPSLFHDDDDRSWLVNMRWDYRVGHNNFSGIVLQEYDRRAGELTGPIELIFRGTPIGFTEAPHLYKRNGWYYLVTAEGGTEYGHTVTVARSRSIHGPYALHPRTPLLTSVVDRDGYDRATARGADPAPFLHTGLQKAGHGSLAPVTRDVWVLAHLCGRPLPGTRNCPLGRETALQRVEWRDDWPWTVGAVTGDAPAARAAVADTSAADAVVVEITPEAATPADTVTFSDVFAADTSAAGGPRAAADAAASAVWTEHFDRPRWALELQTIREPLADRARLDLRPGFLTLYGGESPTSRFRQSVLARRVQAFRWAAETVVEMEPEDFQQFAGLVVRYNDATQLLLRISRSDAGIRTLGVLEYDRGVLRMPLGDDEIPVGAGPVELGVDATEDAIRFRWRTAAAPGANSGAWQPLSPACDPGKLSDDYAVPLGFTGTFVGIGCFDTSGRRCAAHFDYLTYREWV